VAYPALTPAGEAVDLRLLRNRREAEETHRSGIRALLTLRFRKDLETLRRYLALRGEMKVWSAYFGGARALEDGLYQGLVRRLLERNIRTRRAFEDYVRTLGQELLKAPQKLLEEVEPVLRAYHETRQALAGLEAANLSNRTVLGFLGQMRAELERLLPVSFLELYDRERLPQLARYLKALQIRAERGAVHLDRDRARAAEIRPYDEKLAELRKALPLSASPDRAAAVDEYRWMVEEYRVSLFAQGIKTPYPVSPKRLREKIREIERL
jgi:ATP-dependent helicase HrpA